MTENEMTTEMTTEIPTSPKRLARIAGVLYLLVGITGGFAEGFVEPKMYVAGNPAATAGNVVANSRLVRLAVVAELLDYIFFVFLVMTLYILLQHVHKSVARAMLERVMNLGESRIEMRISRSAWFPRDLRFPHS